MAQRDNFLNQDTNKYAQMDSRDMRTIAAVTLGFLPATFMAVSLPSLRSSRLY